MGKKILKAICGITIAVGLFILIGTAGASDLNTINEATIIKQVFAGMGLMFFGGVVLKLIDPNCFD